MSKKARVPYKSNLKDNDPEVLDLEQYESLTKAEQAKHRSVADVYILKSKKHIDLKPVQGRARKYFV